MLAFFPAWFHITRCRSTSFRTLKAAADFILMMSWCYLVCVVSLWQDYSKNPVHRLFGSREQQWAGRLREPHVQHQRKVLGRQSCPIWPQSEHSLHNGIIRSAWRENICEVFCFLFKGFCFVFLNGGGNNRSTVMDGFVWDSQRMSSTNAVALPLIYKAHSSGTIWTCASTEDMYGTLSWGIFLTLTLKRFFMTESMKRFFCDLIHTPWVLLHSWLGIFLGEGNL